MNSIIIYIITGLLISPHPKNCLQVYCFLPSFKVLHQKLPSRSFSMICIHRTRLSCCLILVFQSPQIASNPTFSFKKDHQNQKNHATMFDLQLQILLTGVGMLKVLLMEVGSPNLTYSTITDIKLLLIDYFMDIFLEATFIAHKNPHLTCFPPTFHCYLKVLSYLYFIRHLRTHPNLNLLILLLYSQDQLKQTN